MRNTEIVCSFDEFHSVYDDNVEECLMWFYWVTTFCLERQIVASRVSVELSHWLHEKNFGIKLFVIVLGLV